MPPLKKIVYEYILPEVLDNSVRSNIPENFIHEGDLNNAPNLQQYLNGVIQPIRSRVQHIPLSREYVTETNPFIVMNLMKYILQQYEGEYLERSEENKPRLFPLFPSPSLKWRFIKIDGQNIATLFPDSRIPAERNESNFSLTVRRFYETFKFNKLSIRRY